MFIVELFKIAKSESRSVVCDSATRPWNSLGQNTGVSSLSSLQGIFPTQGLEAIKTFDSSVEYCTLI